MQRIQVIDSHTEGEPTRVVIDGLPNLSGTTASARRLQFDEEFDSFRSAVLLEPRGFDAIVGALLLPPDSPDAIAQVLFFNNVGSLGMCVHGTIGVAQTLRHLNRLPNTESGRHRLETPVGDVFIEERDDGSFAVENVESYRTANRVPVTTQEYGQVHGDIAWGGNWFFLVDDHGLDLKPSNIPVLTACAKDIGASLVREGIRGGDGSLIDHIELFGPASGEADSRNFVLCPGGEYDRSPCGTGTSAKMACLAADGELSDHVTWRQESIIGSCFLGTVRNSTRGVIPTVSGRAWITAETHLLIAPDDPFAAGIQRG